ncbi:MAG: hypothetical protein HY805_00170 [Nitrospirae bacterium]|nr:hypothetical protein [Nitrospirota bacterium]
MNIFQRIVLVLGAIALAVVLWTTPQFISVEGNKIKYNPKTFKGTLVEGFAPQRDIGTIAMRSITVIGSTFLIFYALKGIGKKK